MAQHASPHWYAQMEYLRLRLRSLVRGLGILPLSTSPIRSRIPWSHPPEHLLLPRVEEAEGEDDDEDRHLHHAEPLVGLDPRGEGEDEHRLHVEHHEQQGEDVVADLALTPSGAHRVDAR